MPYSIRWVRSSGLAIRGGSTADANDVRDVKAFSWSTLGRSRKREVATTACEHGISCRPMSIGCTLATRSMEPPTLPLVLEICRRCTLHVASTNRAGGGIMNLDS